MLSQEKVHLMLKAVKLSLLVVFLFLQSFIGFLCIDEFFMTTKFIIFVLIFIIVIEFGMLSIYLWIYSQHFTFAVFIPLAKKMLHILHEKCCIFSLLNLNYLIHLSEESLSNNGYAPLILVGLEIRSSGIFYCFKWVVIFVQNSA